MKSFDDVRRAGGSVGIVFSRRGATASTVVAFVVIAACNKASTSVPLLCTTPVPEIPDAAALVDASAVCAEPGGAWVGPADTHCDEADGGELRQPTAVPGCCALAPADAGADDSGYSETCSNYTVVSGPDNGTCCTNEYNPTMWNTRGSDDDCKYDVSWSSTPVCLGAPVYFTVHANFRVDATTFGSGPPLTGAAPLIEAVLDCNTPASVTQPPPVEFQPGVYQVGPIVFPDPGVWSVRFHFNEHCNDLVPDSPHGHAAFWVLVPGGDGGVPGELEASALEDEDASTSGSSDAGSGGASDASTSGSSDAGSGSSDAASDAVGQ